MANVLNQQKDFWIGGKCRSLGNSYTLCGYIYQYGCADWGPKLHLPATDWDMGIWTGSRICGGCSGYCSFLSWRFPMKRMAHTAGLPDSARLAFGRFESQAVRVVSAALQLQS